MTAWLRGLIDRIETAPTGALEWSATLAGIIVVRHVLEIASGRYPVYTAVQFFVHYPLAYLAPLLALTLVLSLFSGERPQRVAKLMLFAWLLTLLPPLIDVLMGHPRGTQIGYLVEERHEFLTLLARFLDPRYELRGTTRGIRIEAALACLLGATYVLTKGRGWIRAIGCAVVLLPTCLLFFTLPVRFYEATRLVYGDIPIATLYGQAGRVASIQASEIADMAISVYLAAFVLLLFVAFVARTKTGGTGSLLKRIAGMRALLPASCALLGAQACRLLMTAPPGAAVPAEGIAIAGISLSALLAGAALEPATGRGDGSAAAEPSRAVDTHPDPAGAAVRLFLAALSLALAAALGSVTLAMMTALLAVGWLFLAPQFRLGKTPVLGEMAWGAAAAFAGAAGASVFLGREVIVRMPPPLILALIAAGILVRFVCLPGEGSVRILRAAAAGLACLAPPIVLGEPRLALPLAFVGAAVALIVYAGSFPPVQAFAPIAVAAGLTFSGLLAVAAPEAAVELQRQSLRSPYYHLRLGDAARARGDREEARRDYLRAIEIEPDFVPGRSQLGQLLLEDADFDGAIEHFGRAAEADPGNSKGHNNLGAALLSAGRTADALGSFEEAIRLDGGNCSALYNRAVALDLLERVAPAAGAWSDYVERCSHRPDEAESVEAARKRLGIR